MERGEIYELPPLPEDKTEWRKLTIKKRCLFQIPWRLYEDGVCNYMHCKPTRHLWTKYWLHILSVHINLNSGPTMIHFLCNMFSLTNFISHKSWFSQNTANYLVWWYDKSVTYMCSAQHPFWYQGTRKKLHANIVCCWSCKMLYITTHICIILQLHYAQQETGGH